MRYRSLTLAAVTISAGLMLGAPAAHADGDNNTLVPNNKRLNDGVVANVYTVQHQAGCANDVKINPQLQLAAQRHTDDVLNNRDLDADIGSDGSTAQDRANAAGYRGTVAETVAINPALAISGVELINQWYYNRLRPHPDGGVVRKQSGSHRRGGRLREARRTSRDRTAWTANRASTWGGPPGEFCARSQPGL